MSISVILRAQGAASGGEIRDIAGDGTIDNQAEAQAALALIGSSDSVIIIGGDSFDRTRLERIRDGQGSQGAGPASGDGAGLALGTIQSSQDIPNGSRLYLFVNGNPTRFGVRYAQGEAITWGDSCLIAADRRPSVFLPSSTPDSPPDHPHSVEYRFSRPGLAEARDTRMTTIRPAVATLSNVSILPPSSGTSFAREGIRIRFNTSLAGEHRVRVNIGGHAETITVPAGAAGREYTATLSGEPRSWADIGGTPDRRTGRTTVAVSATPLGTGERVGTTQQGGSVTITRPRPSGGGGAPRPAAPTPGRLPGAGGR